MKFNTQLLCRLALLVALNIILSRVFSIRIPLGGAEAFRIGFGSLPVIFAGAFFGPLAGSIVGALGDMLGFFISPQGAYMPHFTLTAALRGIIPGLIILATSRGRKQVGIFSLFLATAVTLVLADIILLPYFLETLFGISRLVTVPTRIIQNAVTIPVYTAALFGLGKLIKKVLSPGWQGDIPTVTGKLW